MALAFGTSTDLRERADLEFMRRLGVAERECSRRAGTVAHFKLARAREVFNG